MIDFKQQGFYPEEIRSTKQEAEEYLLDMFKSAPQWMMSSIDSAKWDKWIDTIADILAARVRYVALDAVLSAVDEIEDGDMYKDWMKFGEPTDDERYPVMEAYHQIFQDLANYRYDDLVSKETYRKFGLA